MKQRIITATLIIAILVPIFLAKLLYDINDYIYLLGFVLTVVAMKEMISVKESEKRLPLIVHLIAYLAVVYFAFGNSFNEVFFSSPYFNLNIIPLLVILLLLITVINKDFTINDASFILFTVLYIGFAFKSLVHFFLKVDGMYELFYIILIAVFTDTFAYFTGVLFGKHKLCPRISPNKTIEGAIGGSLVAVILVTIYVVLIDKIDFIVSNSLYYIIILTFILTILAQFGDLAASSIKRHFKVKDYGNLFPGHGGVLDRLDSILFTSLCYFYLTELLALII